MSQLASLNILPVYIRGQNDIASEFYLPCMERAIRYDRAVGFFSSTIYIIAWPALKDFVRRGGRMRIICSPLLTEEDKEALTQGYLARVEEETAKRLAEEIRQLLASPFLEKPARVLASLVAIGVIEVKIAYMGEADARHRKLFHDKVGIIQDECGNTVVFKGSMNETYAGLSCDGNLESVDVFVSWGGDRDLQRIKTEIDYFNRLWENKYPSVTVRDFPSIAREELYSIADADQWPDLVDEILKEMKTAKQLSGDAKSGRTPRPHQVQALTAWMARGRRGIFEHATGSGKTFTALCAIRDSLSRGEVPIILVPSRLLLSQWMREIRETLSDIDVQVLPCGDGHVHWKEGRALKAFTRPGGNRNRVVLAMMQTACTDMFLTGLWQGDHLFMVADEVHRLGSPEHRKILTVMSGPRLGLSATPRRAGDPEGTKAIMDYFGGIVPPPYTLADAIRDNVLTPYYYYPYQVSLSTIEQKEWNRITNQIRILYSRMRQQAQPDSKIEEQIKKLLIKRARIVKGAAAKVDLALDIVKEHYRSGQWWLVYCDSQNQLYSVLHCLRSAGYDAYEYHSAMESDREETIRYFAAYGGILVSIRCLDEGVDIPMVSHALILASSQNPREFIQRRGRVLRKAPDKDLSYIFDAIVLPKEIVEDAPPSTAILEAELVRAVEFGKHAINPASITELQRIAIAAGLDFDRLAEEGIEIDDERD